MHGPMNVKSERQTSSIYQFIKLPSHVCCMFRPVLRTILRHVNTSTHTATYNRHLCGPFFTFTANCYSAYLYRFLCLVSSGLSYSFVFMHIRVLTGVLSTYAYHVIYIVIILRPPKCVCFYYPDQQIHNIYIYRVFHDFRA